MHDVVHLLVEAVGLAAAPYAHNDLRKVASLGPLDGGEREVAREYLGNPLLLEVEDFLLHQRVEGHRISQSCKVALQETINLAVLLCKIREILQDRFARLRVVRQKTPRARRLDDGRAGLVGCRACQVGGR